jgi:hypothetical protein
MNNRVPAATAQQDEREDFKEWFDMFPRLTDRDEVVAREAWQARADRAALTTAQPANKQQAGRSSTAYDDLFITEEESGSQY